MMYIEELITLGKMVYKDMTNKLFRERLTLSAPKTKSLATMSNDATYFFPVVASDNLSSDEIVMIMRAIERSYAIFARTAFMLIPAVEVNSFNDSTVKTYLQKFHNNIGARSTGYSIDFKLESSVSEFNQGVLNEALSDRVQLKSNARFGRGAYASTSSGGDNVSTDDRVSLGQRYRINDTDWKKANDLIPTSMMVPAKFIVRDDDGKVTATHVVDIPVNIKATMHRSDSSELTRSIADGVANKKGFLNFVKFVSREEKSAMDFLFGISQMKKELLNSKANKWLGAFKRRKRLAQMSWSFLSDNFKPIATIVLTMNEVNTLKERYGIDVFKEAQKIMNEYYLLGFIIADQVNEILYVQFDSHPGFQEYPYKTLEREAANQDRVVKDLIKNMGAFR